jgi:hypothetical protein
MPNLTRHTAWTCATNIDEWFENVKSSDGRRYYMVKYGELGSTERKRQGCLYGFTCDCSGFKFRATCKHVEQAKKNLCQWNVCMDPGLPPDEYFVCSDCGIIVADEDGCCTLCGKDAEIEKRCPNCKGPVRPMQVGA